MNIDPRNVARAPVGDYEPPSIYVAMVGPWRVTTEWALNAMYAQIPPYARWKVREVPVFDTSVKARNEAVDKIWSDFLIDPDHCRWLLIWPAETYLMWNAIHDIIHADDADVISMDAGTGCFAIQRDKGAKVEDGQPCGFSRKVDRTDLVGDLTEVPEIPVIDPAVSPEQSMVVCVPTLGFTTLKWASTLMGMDSAMGMTTYLHVVKGYEVGDARCRLVDGVLRMKPVPKFLLFLGDDNLPPAHGVQRLYWNLRQHNMRACSGLYRRKANPPDFVAWRKGCTIIEGKDFDMGNVVEVDGCGLDFALMHTEDLVKIPEPRFKTVHEQNRLMTEDVYFWRRFWETHRIRPFVDTSINVGHIDWKSGIIF